jgi:hypothetical protein
MIKRLQKWYWCGRSASAVDIERENGNKAVDYGEKKSFFEDAPPNNQVGIKIRNLTKVNNSCAYEDVSTCFQFSIH